MIQQSSFLLWPTLWANVNEIDQRRVPRCRCIGQPNKFLTSNKILQIFSVDFDPAMLDQNQLKIFL